jgi:hypothetical protein
MQEQIDHCLCGAVVEKGSKHRRDCKVLKKLREDFFLNNIENIILHYQEHYSVSKILRDFTIQGQVVLQREKVEKILKENNIYEGLYGENYLKKKVEVNKITLNERYGVINPGQLENGGYAKMNKIPYNKFTFIDEDFRNYREKVYKITKINLSKIDPPKFCEYTGILFADEEDPTNPNDPRKRSVDHVLPIVWCYFNDVEPTIAGSLENIKFVLKYVNTIKSNTLHESFLPIALKIRKALINEGFESN